MTTELYYFRRGRTLTFLSCLNYCSQQLPSRCRLAFCPTFQKLLGRAQLLFSNIALPKKIAFSTSKLQSPAVKIQRSLHYIKLQTACSRFPIDLLCTNTMLHNGLIIPESIKFRRELKQACPCPPVPHCMVQPDGVLPVSRGRALRGRSSSTSTDRRGRSMDFSCRNCLLQF